ncbi:ubiquitin carboxyl-terminal hydrolase [Borealophlyctis nickersoniae]|nr:ubiquitin carboxyl-terminal hydrolase [Borealophlyctis nickersoniae]
MSDENVVNVNGKMSNGVGSHESGEKVNGIVPSPVGIDTKGSVSGAKSVDALSVAEPSVENQGDLRIRIDEASRNMNRGETYFLLSKQWYQRWSQLVDSAGLKQNAAVIQPGAIDNTRLFEDKTFSRVREDLYEGSDFVAVPRADWATLVSWFGIIDDRQAVERPTKQDQGDTYKIDLIPFVLGVVLTSSSGEPAFGVEVYSGETLRSVKEKICRERNISNSDGMQLWKLSDGDLESVFDDETLTVGDVDLDGAQRVVGFVEGDDAGGLAVVRKVSPPVNGAWPMDGIASGSPLLPLESDTNARDSGLAADEDDDDDADILSSPFGQIESKRESAMRKGKSAARADEDEDSSSSTPLLLMGPEPKGASSSFSFKPATSLSRQANGYGSTKFVTKLPVGATGLNNLGNTCFMNSALQCLSNTAPLTTYILSERWREELNLDNPLGMKGEIAKEYAELIANLWRARERLPSYAPRDFKYTMGRFNSMFQGYGQQDSQELLQSLLDGLHEDLNRIKKKPYIENPDMDGQPDEEIARVAWEIYSKRNDSAIVDLFQGQYKSRLQCTECGKLSVTFDPYMFLSLPVPERREITRTIHAMPATDPSKPVSGERPRLVHIRVPRDASIKLLAAKVAEKMGWREAMEDANRLATVEIFRKDVYKIFQNTDRASDIGERDDVYVVDLGTLDRHLFEKSDEDDSTPVHLSAFFLREGRTSFYSDDNKFGVPIVVTLPAKIGVRVPKREANSERITEYVVKRAGKRIYRQVVRCIRRFAVVDLWRRVGDDKCVQEVFTAECERRQRREPTSSMDVDREEDGEEPDSETSDVDLGEDWEPLPGLFRLELVVKRSSQYGYSTLSSANRTIVLYDEDGETSEEQEGDDGRNISGHTSARASRESSASPQLLTQEAEEDESNEDAKEESTDGGVDDGTNSTASTEDAEDEEDELRELDLSGDCCLQMVWNRKIANMVFGGGTDKYEMFMSDDDAEAEQPNGTDEPRKKKVITLRDCIDEFRKEELLEGGEAWYCPGCKEHRTTKKQLDIWSVPEVLVFHLKRFSSSGRASTFRSMTGDKIEAFVDAPTEGLDLRDVVIGRHPARRWRSQIDAVEGHARDADLESLESRSDVEINPEVDDDAKDEYGLVYDLFAVSNHFGGLGGGHYTAYAKNPLDDEWYNFDDSRVTKVEADNVMTSAAYLLFYQRRHKHKRSNLAQIVEDLKNRPSRGPSPPPPTSSVPPIPPPRPKLSLESPSSATSSTLATATNSPESSPSLSSDESEMKNLRNRGRKSQPGTGLGILEDTFPRISVPFGIPSAHTGVGFQFGTQIGDDDDMFAEDKENGGEPTIPITSQDAPPDDEPVENIIIGGPPGADLDAELESNTLPSYEEVVLFNTQEEDVDMEDLVKSPGVEGSHQDVEMKVAPSPVGTREDQET